MKNSNQRNGWRTYFTDDQAGANVSWGAIFAGVLTFLAMFLTLSLISSAIGFGKMNLTSSNPLEGVGTGLIIWTVIMVILSFLSAGFIAGVAARRVGLLHGFLTWALSILLVVVMVGATSVTAFSAVGSLFGSVASGAGQGASAIASVTGDAISAGFDKVSDNIGEVNTQELQGNLEKYLKDTDVAELQPDYIKGQLKDSADEVKQAAKDILLNPNDSDKIINSTADSLEARAKKIGDSADKDAIANAVAKNSDLSKEEADKATDNIYNELQKASKEAQNKVETARTELEQAQKDLKSTIEDAREQAEEATNAVAKASIWGFVAMLAGLIITSLAGLAGSNLVRQEPTVAK